MPAHTHTHSHLPSSPIAFILSHPPPSTPPILPSFKVTNDLQPGDSILMHFSGFSMYNAQISLWSSSSHVSARIPASATWDNAAKNVAITIASNTTVPALTPFSFTMHQLFNPPGNGTGEMRTEECTAMCCCGRPH